MDEGTENGCKKESKTLEKLVVSSKMYTVSGVSQISVPALLYCAYLLSLLQVFKLASS